MKKGKPSFKSKYKASSFFVIVVVFAIGIMWIGLQNKSGESNVLVLSESTAKTFYPTLYSTSNITENAVISDPRFRNMSVIPREDLLSNVISSVKKSTGGLKSTGQENGTWLWTPLLDITPSYRTSIISGAKKNGIKAIYLSIDSYLDIFVMTDGLEKEAKKKAFTLALENFIIEAHKNNIAVDAEAGWQNWAEEGNPYKAFVVLNYAIQFNVTAKEKLRGFQFDVEPYLLPAFEKNKSAVLKRYLSLIDQSVTQLDGSDLELSVVVPDFYDSTSRVTPKFNYKGKSGYTFDHLLSVLERREGSKIIVMSYRNFSKGDDGSIDISKGEITKADGHNTKIIIAQETGDVPPPYVTFYGTSHSYLDKQIASIQTAFSGNKSFGGIAVHYVNAFLELK